MSLKQRINIMRRHPSIILDIFRAKNWGEIEEKSGRLDEEEINGFITNLRKTSVIDRVNTVEHFRLNRLCCVEDWENSEIIDTLSQIRKFNSEGFKHRKDWEWAMGILAIQKFGKLNENSTALGVGTGTEPVPFYLANKIKHVYATDLYGENSAWERAAPLEFYDNPEPYSSFPYNKDALTVSIMDGTKLEFPSETFDVAFSFSSIEHFGGKNHSGALRGLREMERVLRPDGLAIITTEYIINNKDHKEFFNKRTIYSDLINKLEYLRLVEPLYLGTTTKTLNTVIDFSMDMNWDSLESDFKKIHPLILVRLRNILFTSIVLVFKKL
jgi:SAM-dependent methyltransferase